MTQSLEVGSNSNSRYCPLKRKRCERSLLCSPYTNSTYSALLLPRWLLASQRYVPLSVLFSVVMVSSWPSTIMRSMSGSSPPSLDHSTDSGLEAKTRELLTVFLRTRRCKFLNSVRVKTKKKIDLTGSCQLTLGCLWKHTPVSSTGPPAE